MSTDLPDHFCPGCGARQRAFARYPGYFCQAGLKSACDGQGQGLEFSNATLFGGLVWRLRGTNTWHDAVHVKCLISGRPVLVHEARFGGVVGEPFQTALPPMQHENVTDLTGS
ncbi:MAG TPA: ADP-ribosylglycohydrolase [Aliiroseovarius sp.]|nr:ADP-ribosylglycohydrolase [Aliiroseovarius sp.]